MLKPHVLFVLLALAGFVVPAHADYPLGKGRVNLTISYNNLSTNKYFNSQKKLIKNQPGEYFTSHSYSLSVLYGLARNVDILVVAPWLKVHQQIPTFVDENRGVGDLLFGIAYHIPSEDYQKYFTLKAQVVAPAYNNQETPSLGFSAMGLQLGANYSFSPYHNAFMALEAFYVRYFDVEGPNQLRGIFTFGQMLDNYTPLSFNFTHQSSWSGDLSFTPNPLSNKSFYSGSVGANISRRITRTITPAVLVNYTVYGRNVSVGLNVGAMLSIRLP